MIKMIDFENYKNNLEIVDKPGISDVVINKSVIYSGHIDSLKKNYSKCKEENCNVPLAATIVGLNNTAAPLPQKDEFYNAWSDIDAQELYLAKKPTCYLILNKPGAGAYGLGEAISKKFNCIHLCPQNIILDELEQKNSTGMCLDFNMKHNKVCKFDTFFKMLQIKLESPAVKHRGYIISGFPMMSACRSPKYLVDSLYSEEAVMVVDEILFDTICNLKKKKPKKPKEATGSPGTSVTSEGENVGEEEEVEEEPEPEELPAEEEEELKVELPKFVLDACSDIIHPIKPYYKVKKVMLLQQLNDLFNLSMAPDVILYISCVDKDLITKKSHKYINYKNNHHIVEPFIAKAPSDVRWPVKYSSYDYSTPFDTHVFNPKYSCRQPINFEQKSIQQMCNYKQDLLSTIENILKDFDPMNIIKLDGRLTLHEMMHNVSERLLMMSIVPAIIPEPLYMEEPPEDMEEFWKSVEELNVIRNGELTFKKTPSVWYNRCPVELKKRQSVRGNPKLGVTFSKYVYLPATLENMISFCRNPRPYLKLNFLEPTCRIIVIGTKYSGKTMISECLSWLFDTPVIYFNSFLESEKQKKYNTFATTILSEIIATIEDARLANWENLESDRLSKLSGWCTTNIMLMKKYTPLLLKFNQYTQSKQDSLENDNDNVDYQPQNTDFLNAYHSLRNTLNFLPILDDIDQCEKSFIPAVMAQYAPEHIRRPLDKPAIPIISDTDVIEAIAAYIVANELQKEIEPTVEELMTELFRIIASIDSECQSATNFESMFGKYIIDGLPSDPEYWTILSDTKSMPDYTVALIENREVDADLLEFYKSFDNVMKNYHERYTLANDPLIKTKLNTKKMPESKLLDVKIILHDIMKNNFNTYLINNEIEKPEESPTPDPWATFSENIDKFKEEWESVKGKIEERNKCFIDVELEAKSDIQVVEEVLLKLRKCYFLQCEVLEGEDEDQEEEPETPKDILSYNNSKIFGETSHYCPIAFYDYRVLWEGKAEFGVRFDNKLHYFCKEECLEKFQKDITKYQSYNKPYKDMPPYRICVVGCIGSGKTTISKLLAKELGLMYVDFDEALNDMLIPKHFKKVGRKYDNPFTDGPIDEEAAVEIQMDEGNDNFVADILSNEKDLRRMVHNYVATGAPLLPPLMQIVINKLWYHGPFRNTGFVLDGYPKLPNDVEDMVANFCIPDLVIELEGNSENTVKRKSLELFKTWKMQLAEAKEKARQKLANEKKDWLEFLTKNIVTRLIIDEILGNMFPGEPTMQLSNESVMLDAHPSGSIIDTAFLNIYNEMVQEFPEPVDQSEWDKPDDVREKINEMLESTYETDDENIQALKELLSEQKIKTVSVDGNKSLIKVTRVTLSKVTNLRSRNESFFESTYIINADIAELLITGGHCFLSKFKRVCPVYLFENPNAIQDTYRINKQKGQVFTVIHRSYIYFICGSESVKKFRTNPLKYVTCDNVRQYQPYTLRIGIIGTPKSGKSSLSAKLAKRYGLICLSKGIAIRDALHNKHWTVLATKMNSTLNSGECMNSDLIIKAIQGNMAMDHCTITNGFVLDGCPETASEAMELVKVGLYPNIIFYISTDIETTVQSSQKEIYYEIIKRNPPYSRPFIENRYRMWQNQSYNITEWIDGDYQNSYVIDGNKSKWQCLQDAVKVIEDFIPKVHHYLINVQTNAVPAHVMCISNEIFESRISNLKNMCPLCLRKNVLRHNAYPVDKKGVIQYENKYYWICSEHMDTVLQSPHLYLSVENINLPEIPAVVKTINMSLVYANGICIVTYAENLPAQKITRGTNKFAASFKGNTYMFCSKTCLEKFLAKPHLYFDITVFKQTNFPPICLKKLPNLGYLEQTLGTILTEACCAVNVHRPKYPGLSFQVSGLLHIALYLKTHNPRMDKSFAALYIKSSEVYDARCRLLMHVALFLRSMENPFARYPKCCRVGHIPICASGTEFRSAISTRCHSRSSSDIARRVPVPDERFDYLVEFHKPASKVPAFLNVVDIAGLVRGAAEGQGLGNAFLSHIKACDAIFNLCRAFDDEDVIHVDGDVNPVRDLETIGEELRLKDEEQLMANFEKLDRVVSRGGDKKLKPEYDALTRIKAVLVDEKKHIRFGDWSAADIEVINKYLFLTSKPALYLVNLSEKDYIRKKNKWLPKLKEWIDKNDPGAPLIPFSGVLETKLMDMDPEERKAYLKEHNITSALEKIIVQGYKALNLEYFFTAGPDEVKAWTIQKGTKAPQAAGRIHTDFEKGFIMAEVMHYKDFKEEGTEAACKSAGKYRQQGRNYVVEDGDIIFFKFNAGAGLKDAKKK